MSLRRWLATALLGLAAPAVPAALLDFSDDERARAVRMGVKAEDHIYTTEELAQGHVMFAATGVTQGYLLDGVTFTGGGATTQSIVMRSKSGTVRRIHATHRFDTKPAYFATGGQS